MADFIEGDLRIVGDLTVGGNIKPLQARTSVLQQRDLAEFPVPFYAWRVWDAIGTNTPTTAASDDLGLAGSTTYGTDAPYLTTSDAKATTVTQRARTVIRLPDNYVDGETVKIRITGGMKTTVSDGTATVDVEAWKLDDDRTVGAADLCATSATTINSLTVGDDDFTITATGLAKGDELDVRITIAITDGATGTAVLGTIARVTLLCDCCP